MEEKLTCRICFENNKKLKLLTPCDCREPIHMECLKMWIEIKKNPNISQQKPNHKGLSSFVYDFYKTLGKN